ncbi:MAG: Adenylate cyclase [Chloroflexi bacterium AL-W]|nr:Adenylate cyclase [Chloroflexi bacterium AL-N1]NOK71129.1 Adenylate cyclase [Chloroflexi bacterium AL-N10]NOK78595.1 Adenylate cyclase [Chloroflexi bacterium AL-N5]NOK85891.1 Adenylate cyclase [Chloroflexi bacterium AL-W]NOK92866.1 Adenylate cyclase [Chloroflexi bacterium AL-N15]
MTQAVPIATRPNLKAAQHATDYMSGDEPSRILVVEDNPEMGQSLAALLEEFGYSVELVTNGYAALESVFAHPPDLVVLDIQLPDIDGYTICTKIKQNPLTWPIPVIMVTVRQEPNARLRGIEVEVDEYLLKPVEPREFEARVRVLLRAKRRNDHLEHAEDVIFALARAVEAKDPYTEGHLRRMEEVAVAIGMRLGIRGQQLVALRYGAILHDVGKVGIDEAIIRKRGPLTDEEYTQMKQHTIIGEQIVRPLRLSSLVSPIVRHHHERWNGQGYPDQLAGENIPLGARIVAVVDAFDAMTTQRPYNRVLSIEEASNRICAGAGIYWDPRLVVIFLGWLQSVKQVASGQKIQPSRLILPSLSQKVLSKK